MSESIKFVALVLLLSGALLARCATARTCVVTARVMLAIGAAIVAFQTGLFDLERPIATIATTGTTTGATERDREWTPLALPPLDADEHSDVQIAPSPTSSVAIANQR